MESSLNISKATRNYGKLVKKQVTGKDGKTHTVWVDPNKGKHSEKDSKVQQKTQNKKAIKDTNEKQPIHSEKEIAKIKEITQRHTEFETQLKDQRKAYGDGPAMPKVGAIMRVYAKGKANIGGMLGKIKNIAKDGKSAIVQLTSGGFYSFPMTDLQIAKSSLMVDIQKAKYIKRITNPKGSKNKYRYFYNMAEYKEYQAEKKRLKEAVKNQKSLNAKAKQAKEPKKEAPKAPVTRGVKLEKDKVPTYSGNQPKTTPANKLEAYKENLSNAIIKEIYEIALSSDINSNVKETIEYEIKRALNDLKYISKDKRIILNQMLSGSNKKDTSTIILSDLIESKLATDIYKMVNSKIDIGKIENNFGASMKAEKLAKEEYDKYIKNIYDGNNIEETKSIIQKEISKLGKINFQSFGGERNFESILNTNRLHNFFKLEKLLSSISKEGVKTNKQAKEPTKVESVPRLPPKSAYVTIGNELSINDLKNEEIAKHIPDALRTAKRLSNTIYLVPARNRDYLVFHQLADGADIASVTVGMEQKIIALTPDGKIYDANYKRPADFMEKLKRNKINKYMDHFSDSSLDRDGETLFKEINGNRIEITPDAQYSIPQIKVWEKGKLILDTAVKTPQNALAVYDNFLKKYKENNFDTMPEAEPKPEASATPQVEVFDDDEPKTVQEFMELPDAKNVSDLSSNVKEILSRYSGKKMGVFQANKYLVENKELGYEWMKSMNIASQEKLDLYLEKLHTKARSEKAKAEKPQKEKNSKFFQDLEFAKLEDFVDKVVAGIKAKKQNNPVEQTANTTLRENNFDTMPKAEPKPVIPQLINTKITEADPLFQKIQTSVPMNPSNFSLSSNGHYLTINGQIFTSGDILTLPERQFTPKRKNAKTITIPEQKVKVSKFYQDNRMNDVVRVSYLLNDEDGDTFEADEKWNKFKELDIANTTHVNTGEPKTMIGEKLLLHGKVVEVVKQKPSPIGMFYSVKDGNGKILPMMLETNFKPLQTEGTKQTKIAEVVKNTKKPAVPKTQENNFETMPEVEQDGINYRHEIEKLKNKKFKTAKDQKLINLYEKRLNADVSKFKIGDGVQYNLLGQTNKGVILSVDQSTGMATIRLKGGFADLDQYGNYTDNPIVSVHVGDLKRHNALNQNKLTKIAEVVKNTKKPAVPKTQENNFETMPENVKNLENKFTSKEIDNDRMKFYYHYLKNTNTLNEETAKDFYYGYSSWIRKNISEAEKLLGRYTDKSDAQLIDNYLESIAIGKPLDMKSIGFEERKAIQQKKEQDEMDSLKTPEKPIDKPIPTKLGGYQYSDVINYDPSQSIEKITSNSWSFTLIKNDNGNEKPLGMTFKTRKQALKGAVLHKNNILRKFYNPEGYGYSGKDISYEQEDNTAQTITSNNLTLALDQLLKLNVTPKDKTYLERVKAVRDRLPAKQIEQIENSIKSMDVKDKDFVISTIRNYITDSILKYGETAPPSVDKPANTIDTFPNSEPLIDKKREKPQEERKEKTMDWTQTVNFNGSEKQIKYAKDLIKTTTKTTMGAKFYILAKLIQSTSGMDASKVIAMMKDSWGKEQTEFVESLIGKLPEPPSQYYDKVDNYIATKIFNAKWDENGFYVNNNGEGVSDPSIFVYGKDAEIPDSNKWQEKGSNKIKEFMKNLVK
jgi:hypothetical protein